jgi:hypothetical protein
VDASVSQKLHHVLVSRLAEGEPVEHEIVFQPAVAIVVVAERVRKHVALDLVRAFGDPVRSELIKAICGRCDALAVGLVPGVGALARCLEDLVVVVLGEAPLAAKNVIPHVLRHTAAMVLLQAGVDVTGAKAVVIGDHRQLGAVGPGGGLEALVNRHGPALHVLDENVRQRDPAGRRALEELRAGSVAAAVDWYRANDRLVTAPTRHEVLDAAVDAWFADVRAGREAVLMAWRRSDVAALNERARQRLIAAGLVAGPELKAPGGKRYAAGDRVVTLAPWRSRPLRHQRARHGHCGAPGGSCSSGSTMAARRRSPVTSSEATVSITPTPSPSTACRGRPSSAPTSSPTAAAASSPTSP